MNYTREDFFAGKICCRCDTREEYDQLMRECEGKGIKWNSGMPLNSKRLKTIDAGQPETFGIIGGGLVYNIFDYDNALPFSALFPIDPWADFCAGRCYLRVTKEEWPEFANRCEAAGMKIYDGCYIRGGKWNCDYDARMFRYMSTTQGMRVIDGNDGITPSYDFSAIARPEALPRKIIITTDGRVTTARLIEGKQTVKTATATCDPRDKFDFEKGARLAFDRLAPVKSRDGITIDVSIDTTLAMDAAQEVNDALDKLAARVGKLASV